MLTNEEFHILCHVNARAPSTETDIQRIRASQPEKVSGCVGRPQGAHACTRIRGSFSTLRTHALPVLSALEMGSG